MSKQNEFNNTYEEVKRKSVIKHNLKSMTPKRVIFSNPATIAFWEDGTKTVVKCSKDDIYNKEQGLALCIMKYLTGNTNAYHKIFEQFCEEDTNGHD